MIDYVQLMNGRSLVGPKANREEEVSKCTKAIKELARELDVPIILLSQIGRGSERTKDKRPGLADLRESGAIEADADAVVILFREDYYLKERTPQDRRGLVELMIEKNRDGATGTAFAKFFGKYKLFADWDGPPPDVEGAS